LTNQPETTPVIVFTNTVLMLVEHGAHLDL
jgi:hypothetical protein